MKHVGCKVSDDTKEKIESLALATGQSESAIIRKALEKGLNDDVSLIKIQVETLCMLRRLVANTDIDLWKKAKEDAVVVLGQLGIE